MRFGKNLLTMHISSVDLKYFKLSRGSKILDIGVGNGERSLNFARHDFLTYALDSSKQTVSQLEDQIESYGFLSIQVVHGRAESLPFSDGFFDGVLMIETLEHVSQKKKALREVYRATKTGGFFCLGIPTFTSECLYNFLNSQYLKEAGHVHIFKREEIIGELNSLDFKILKIKKENFVPAIFWALNSLLKINPTPTGEINENALLTRVYSKFWGILHVLRVAKPLIMVGNQIFPKSIYIYCQKE